MNLYSVHQRDQYKRPVYIFRVRVNDCTDYKNKAILKLVRMN